MGENLPHFFGGVSSDLLEILCIFKYESTSKFVFFLQLSPRYGALVVGESVFTVMIVGQKPSYIICRMARKKGGTHSGWDNKWLSLGNEKGVDGGVFNFREQNKATEKIVIDHDLENWFECLNLIIL